MRTFAILTEDPIALGDLRKHVKRPPTYSVLWKWCRRGIQVKAGPHCGQRVTLDYYSMGGTPVTSVEAYYRFLRAVNGEEKKSAEDPARQAPVS